MEQGLLFDVVRAVPDWHVELMQLVNAGARVWSWKDLWYGLKNEILKGHASDNGYDGQVIKHDCWNCHGTGGFKGTGNECMSCGGSGVYSSEYVLLKRWLLNGVLFHEPVKRLVYLKQFAEYRPVSLIDGYVRHENVASEGVRFGALLVLLAIYDRKKCYVILNRWGNRQKVRCKEWGELVARVKGEYREDFLVRVLCEWFCVEYKGHKVWDDAKRLGIERKDHKWTELSDGVVDEARRTVYEVSDSDDLPF